MITLDDEVADSIALASLKEHKQILENQLIEYEQGNKWLHQDDVRYYKKLVKSMKRVIEYYGEDQWLK